MENFQFDRVTVSEGAGKFPLSNEKQGERERKRKRLTHFPVTFCDEIFDTTEKQCLVALSQTT